ncbi:hypothetical protein EYD19_24395, partial [Klebsiella pneumoniae]
SCNDTELTLRVSFRPQPEPTPSIVDLRHGGVYTTAPVDTQEGQSQARELLATHPCKGMMGHA